MKLTWKITPDASCWHTLLAQASGASLQEATSFSGVPSNHIALTEAATAWLNDDTLPTDPTLVGGIEHCRNHLMPQGEADFAEHLRLRSGPLREQWDARGPGLLRALGSLTDPIVGAPATILPVEPVVGGHGIALPDARTVLIEAVLANPLASLPEVLRLGWLVAQLDAPRETVPALVPAVLAAAEEVELAQLDEPTLEQAIVAWRVSEEPISTAATLLAWWHDYRASLTPWPIAVKDITERLR